MRVRYSSRPFKITDKVAVSSYTMGKVWNRVNFILLGGIIIVLLAFVFTSEDLADYVAGSSIQCCMMFIFTTLTIVTFIADRTRMKNQPIYHSPWIYPIYKYSVKDNDVEPYNSAVTLFYSVCFVSFMWSLRTTMEINPSWLGIMFTCAVECVLIVATLYFINTNNLRFKQVRPYVDALIIK